jgi:hypothetical protein
MCCEMDSEMCLRQAGANSNPNLLTLELPMASEVTKGPLLRPYPRPSKTPSVQ